MSSNRVRFPEEGDCVAMRMDPVASAAHVGSEDLTADVAALGRGWYLGFISKVVAGPEEAMPWITCIVHIVPQPSSQTGPVIDFQPRCRTVVRMRAGLVHKQETVQLSSRLMHELRVDAARWWNPKSEDSASRWPGSNVEWWSEIPNRTRLLEDQWDGSDENVDNRPEYSSASENEELAEVPADLELAGDDTDVQPLVAFSYAWREDYGTPKGFIAEFDAIVVPGATTSAILLERCRQAIAEQCSDLDIREQELATVREGLRARAFASAIPALCSVLQGDEDSNSERSSLSAADGDASESSRITGKRERRSFQSRMLRLGSGLVRKVSGRSSEESL